MQQRRPRRGTELRRREHINSGTTAPPIQQRRPKSHTLPARAAQTLIFAVSIGATGCVETTTQSRLVSDGERPVLVSPKDAQSPLDAQVRYENGLVRGRLGWAQRCRTGVETLSHDKVIELKTANHGAGVASLLLGGFISVASVALLASTDTFSNVETCSNDGCSSPQQDAIAVGLVGVGTGLALGGAGVATFGIKSTSTTVDTVDHPATLSKVSQTTVPCGTGKVAGVGVALIQGMERVASSTTNNDGEFALVVPSRMTGQVAVFIESVPEHIPLLRPNDLVAKLDIPAIAEPRIEAPAAEPQSANSAPPTQ